MAKTKVYFWLKIDKKFFDNLFIKRLKNMPGGYTMTVIYIRLMLESLESDCILYYEGQLEDLEAELALKLDVSEDDIKMTLAYFTKCGVIQIDTDNNAEMTQAKALVQQETQWAKYKREQRKLDGVQNNLTLSKLCPTEIEIELDKEIEKEVEVDKEQPTLTTPPVINQDFQNLYQTFEQEIGRPLSPIQQQELGYMLQDFSPELIHEALREAVNQGKANFSYIKAILSRWKSDNLLTVELVRNSKRTRTKGKETKQPMSYEEWQPTAEDPF